jgi:hypothetical protein
VIPDNHPSTSELDEAQLVSRLGQALRATMLTSNYGVSPRQIGQIAQDVGAAYIRFIQHDDLEPARSQGQQLAQRLSPASVIGLARALLDQCGERPNPGLQLLPPTSRFVGALLESFMHDREAHILQEQNLTLAAYQRVVNRSA